MVSVAHFSDFNNLNKLNNKIPEYAREYKREYQFIRGINKEFKYFINKLDNLNNGLFESNISNRIKYFMKRFLRAQEKGKLKDISEFILPRYDVDNLIFINDRFRMYKIRWDFFNPSDDSDDSDDSDVEVGIDDSDDEDDEVDGKNVYPGFKEIYDIFNLFFSKIKIEGCVSDSDCDSDCDSDSDSVIEIEFVLPDSDSE